MNMSEAYLKVDRPDGSCTIHVKGSFTSSRVLSWPTHSMILTLQIVNAVRACMRVCVLHAHAGLGGEGGRVQACARKCKHVSAYA